MEFKLKNSYLKQLINTVTNERTKSIKCKENTLFDDFKQLMDEDSMLFLIDMNIVGPWNKDGQTVVWFNNANIRKLYNVSLAFGDATIIRFEDEVDLKTGEKTFVFKRVKV